MFHSKELREIIDLSWNGEYDGAEALLKPKLEKNPRYALEYAHVGMFRNGMHANNKAKEDNLVRYQVADRLASAMKYDPSISLRIDELGEELDNDDDDEAIAGCDATDLSDKKRKKLLEKDRKDEKKQEKELKAKLKKIEKAGKKSHPEVEKSWELECDSVYADALLMRGFIQLQLTSYVKGGLNLRKTWKTYQRLLKDIEDHADSDKYPQDIVDTVYFGAGLFYVLLSLVPGPLMTLLRAIGFVADKHKGEELLHRCNKNGGIRAPFAGLMLLMSYLFLPTGLADVSITLGKAQKILKDGLAKWPKSQFCRLYEIMYHKKRGDTKQALKSWQLCLQYGEETNLLKFIHQDTLLMDLKFDEAIKEGVMIVEKTENPQEFEFMGTICLLTAGAYAFKEDLKNAEEWLRKALELQNKKSRQDVANMNTVKRMLEDTSQIRLCGLFCLYIFRNLEHLKANEVLDKHLEFITSIGDEISPETKALTLLYRGILVKKTGDLEKTVKTWTEVQDMESELKKDSAALCWTYYELAELKYKMGKKEEAEKLLRVGSKFKGDGNETVKNRYNIAISQLKKEDKVDTKDLD